MGIIALFRADRLATPPSQTSPKGTPDMLILPEQEKLSVISGRKSLSIIDD